MVHEWRRRRTSARHAKSKHVSGFGNAECADVLAAHGHKPRIDRKPGACLLRGLPGILPNTAAEVETEKKRAIAPHFFATDAVFRANKKASGMRIAFLFVFGWEECRFKRRHSVNQNA